MNRSPDLNRPHVPLANIRVLYIGRAAPKTSLDSIESIQKPLCELYTKDESRSRDTDVDAVLTVLTSGLLVEPVNQLEKDLWLPIQNLHSCAAVRAVVGSLQGCSAELSFVPIDSPSATKGSPYPPIFSCVVGRSNGLPLTDCFAFVCQTNEAAMLTVQATMFAFGNKGGWATDRPSKAALTATLQCRQEKVVIDGADMDDAPSEFYEKPSLSGFFYTPSAGLIQKYHIQGEKCSMENRSYGDLRTPYIPEQPRPSPPSAAAPPPPNPPVNPMIFFDTEQDMMYVDQPVRVQYPMVSDPPRVMPPSGGPYKFSETGPSQSIAFNPYLVPSLDPPIPTPVQPPVAMPAVAKAVTTVIPADPIVIPSDPMIIPVAEDPFAQAPPAVYQKRLPRSNIGIQKTYSDNQDPARHGALTGGSNGGDRKTTKIASQDPFAVIKQPSEELYAHRLPPPNEEPIPSGARLFDSNFILQQSDTDKARIADIKNHEGYPAPRPINIAEFGY